MKEPKEYKALIDRLREEAVCYPDDCDYCSAEGKCKCQRLGEAIDAVEELLPYYLNYYAAAKAVNKYLCCDHKVEVPI